MSEFRPWKCATCGAHGDDGGWVAGRDHLDECPERSEAEVRGFKAFWAMFGGVREVAWTAPAGLHTMRWTQFPAREENA